MAGHSLTAFDSMHFNALPRVSLLSLQHPHLLSMGNSNSTPSNSSRANKTKTTAVSSFFVSQAQAGPSSRPLPTGRAEPSNSAPSFVLPKHPIKALTPNSSLSPTPLRRGCPARVNPQRVPNHDYEELITGEYPMWNPRITIRLADAVAPHSPAERR